MPPQSRIRCAPDTIRTTRTDRGDSPPSRPLRAIGHCRPCERADITRLLRDVETFPGRNEKNQSLTWPSGKVWICYLPRPNSRRSFLQNARAEMISTRDLSELPDVNGLRRLLMSMAVLDAILCRDWQYRYYSFNS